MNIFCWLGFHPKQPVTDAIWTRQSVERHWLDSGKTTYTSATFICPKCREQYGERWSYPSHYDEWAERPQAWMKYDRDGSVLKGKE